MDVSIIIINYNTPQLVIECINSIKTFTNDLRYEIIVVDNASSDNSKSILGSLDDIYYIYSDKNLGFGKANNLGAQYAKGKYLFFLNSDTLLTGTAIYSLFKFCEKYPKNIGACGMILKDSNGNDIHSAGSFPSILKECFLKPSLSSYPNNAVDKGDYISVDYITGADLFMSKTLFEEIDGFDKDFFMYYEETDLQKRIKNKGYEIALIKDRDIIHLEGGSFDIKSQNTPIRRLQMQLESRFIYMKKNTSLLEYYLFRLLYPIKAFPAALLFKCDFKSKTKYIKTLI